MVSPFGFSSNCGLSHGAFRKAAPATHHFGKYQGQPYANMFDALTGSTPGSVPLLRVWLYCTSNEWTRFPISMGWGLRCCPLAEAPCTGLHWKCGASHDLSGAGGYAFFNQMSLKCFFNITSAVALEMDGSS